MYYECDTDLRQCDRCHHWVDPEEIENLVGECVCLFCLSKETPEDAREVEASS